MIRVGYAQIGERRTIVDTAIGAQCAQIPLAGVDLDGLHPGSYLISARTVPWVMAAPASTASPVMVPSL